MLGVLSYTRISCYITSFNLTKHTMQGNREYAIYLSIYSQLYHPDYKCILLCCLFWHSQCCRQSIHMLINTNYIHVHNQKNINDNKGDSLQGF